MGIIGVLIAALNMIPNGEGGTLADNLNPFATTSSSSNTVPDSVKSKVVVQYFGLYGWQDLDFQWLYEPYSEEVSGVTYNDYRAPGFVVRLDPNTFYKVEFDCTNCAGSDNFPMIYNPDFETWQYVNGSISIKSGTVVVQSDNDGYVKLLPVYEGNSFHSDPSYYQDVQARIEENGINIRITENSAG